MDCLKIEGMAEMEQRMKVEEEVEQLAKELESKVEEMNVVVMQLKGRELELKLKFDEDINLAEEQKQEVKNLNTKRRKENVGDHILKCFNFFFTEKDGGDA